MSSSSKVICQATASLKKEPGILKLSTRKLIWDPSNKGSKQQVVTVANSDITSLFASKAGSEPKLKLKIQNSADLLFAFSNLDDSQTFKDHIAEITKRNASNAVSAQSSRPSPSNGHRLSASMAVPNSLAASTPGSRSSSVTPGGGRTFNKNELKRKVLLRSPELAALHKDLVISGQITETEFWDSREHLILAEAAAEGQRKGKSNEIVDPRPVRMEDGENKTTLTSQMIQDIFDEFPVVLRAYQENVPKKLNEYDFWSRYLQSKLASRNSASARGAASEHTVKNDSIFDKYLEKEDDEIEPQRPHGAVSQLFIDLAATEEDHEAGNTKDVTMQAGRQKQALPLIRRFNEHSERLLNSALGSEPPVKRRRVDETTADNEYYDAIVIDDLQSHLSTTGIALEMKDQQRYFEGNKAAQSASVDDSNAAVDLYSVVVGIVDEMKNWSEDMASLRLGMQAAEEAVSQMTSNVQSRLEVRSRHYDLPDEIHQDIMSFQNTTTEILRQYWSTVYPPPPDQILSVSTPAQLSERAEKMIGYLGKTKSKIQVILQKAQSLGFDAHRIEMIFKPTIQAVQKALANHASRTGRR